jgi:hypothetical protein
MNMKINIAVVLGLLAIAGCSDENSKLRGQFLAGCIQGGVSKAICACTFEKLAGKYSPTELKALSVNANPPNSFLRDTVGFAQACQAKD